MSYAKMPSSVEVVGPSLARIDKELRGFHVNFIFHLCEGLDSGGS